MPKCITCGIIFKGVTCPNCQVKKNINNAKIDLPKPLKRDIGLEY